MARRGEIIKDIFSWLVIGGIVAVAAASPYFLYNILCSFNNRKWRIIIFDISDLHRVKREAFRGFLKRLQFYKLQESVWIHPFECKREVELLKEFFGFTSKEIQLIVAEQVENSDFLRTKFKI